MAQSALVVATKAIFPHVPASEGIYNAIDIVNPEGLVTNAQFPRPISGAFATSYEVICRLRLRLLPPDPPRALDGLLREHDQHGRGRVRRPRPGYERDFVMYIWKEGGYGARPGKKDNHTAISLYASGTRNEPVEVQERVYPDPHAPLRVHHRLGRAPGGIAAASASRATSSSPTATRRSRCSAAAA